MYKIKDIKNTILEGNALSELRKIPSKSVNMIFTSPPYWRLRNYNTSPQNWEDGWTGELGQEPTFNLFIEHLLSIFDEAKRVLTDDGTCWINIGDSYAVKSAQKQSQAKDNNVKEKSLYAIPDRFKIAMIDSGWICRNQLIWYKRNAMPESVKDRFTVDYEPIYLFSKKKKYYFDQQKEPCVNGDPTSPRGSRGTKPNSGRRNKNKQDEVGKANYTGFNARYVPRKKRNIRSVWDIPVQPFRGAHFATFPPKLLEIPIISGCPENGIVLDIFFGSGTTGLIAKKINRNYIGIELNKEYIKIAEKRLNE